MGDGGGGLGGALGDSWGATPNLAPGRMAAVAGTWLAPSARVGHHVLPKTSTCTYSCEVPCTLSTSQLAATHVGTGPSAVLVLTSPTRLSLKGEPCLAL